jgi:predicted GIY-YIG superfamily endonuclease
VRTDRPSKSIDYRRRTALYRLFDSEGRLLYVGIAFDPRSRLSDHARQKEWWPTVADRTIEWHATRTEAAAAEVTAIRSEKPLYNVRDTEEEHARRAAHAPGAKIGRMIRLDDDLWDPYGELCAEEGTTRAADIRMYVVREVTAWRKANGLEPPKKRVVRVKRRKPAESDD